MNDDENDFSCIATQSNTDHELVKQKIGRILTHSKRILENTQMTLKSHYNEISKLETWESRINLIFLVCSSAFPPLLKWNQDFVYCLSLHAILNTIIITKFFPNKISHFRKAAAGYQHLKNELEKFIELEIPDSEDAFSLKVKLEKFIEKSEELNEGSRHFSTQSYKKAKKDMDEGTTTYKVDK